MSKVSLKNELLPSFEPIKQKGTSQKRKRAAAASPALKDASANGADSQPAKKRSKAKKNSSAAAATTTPSATTTKTIVCWIGATLMQNEQNIKNEEEKQTAAFSIYYGLNDSHNLTAKVPIQQNQSLDHVYTMGVIRALENCQDDSTSLRIHTGSKSLQSAIEEDSENEIINQIKEKIAKRKGSTSIRYQVSSSPSSNKEDESQIAHTMANEKLLEEDKMMVVDEETLVDSLEVTTSTVTTTTTTTLIKTDDDVKEKTVVTTIEEEEKTRVVEALPPPSWAQTLSLRNLLDVLKAPFYRKQK